MVGRAGRPAIGAVAGIVAAGLLSGGCGQADAARSSAVRDSAGITIVENELPTGTSLAWRVDPEPWLVIGAAEGPSERQLYQVQGATRLSDRSVAIANGGTGELRTFDAEGELVGVAGGRGQGPGEFLSMSLVGVLPGDSVVIHDSRNARFSVLAPGPVFTRSFPVGEDVGEGSVAAVGLLDGPLYVVSGPSRYGGGTLASGTVRSPPRPLMVLGPNGGLRAVLDTFATEPRYLELGETIRITRVPFAATPAFAADSAVVHAGGGEAYEIRSYDAGGELIRLLRLAREPRPVTDADIEAFVDAALERTDEDRRAPLRRSYDAMPFPETMPAYDRLLVDAASNLWVEEYRAHPDEPRAWTVFDPDGRVLGAVEVPAEVGYVFEIGDDWLLGLRRDEMDVPYVVLHRLEKEPSADS